MKKILLLLLAVAAGLLLAQAQSGTLKGIVTDNTGQPIPFANVAIYRMPQLLTGAVANIDGEYSIHPITPGTYDVEFSAVGQQRTRITQVTIFADSILTLNTKLSPGEQLSCVVCCSISGYYTRTRSVQKDQGLSRESTSRMPNMGSRTYEPIKLRGSRGELPRSSADEYAHIKDNEFKSTRREPLSTFSVDVDKASYTLLRKTIRDGVLPPVDAVRVEELINYFDYNYPDPVDEHPIRILTELTDCPWNKESRILKLALQGKRLGTDELPPSSFTFLVDVSGSMSDPNKLPLVQASLLKLLDKLRPQDQVGIVVYAGAAGVVLETRAVGKKAEVVSQIMAMQAGGSTAGGQGIQLAYKLAEEHFIKGGNNRIILCTDGDFNVGISSESDLTGLIEQERQKGIYLTVLGFGMGNYKDAKLELLADKGNGNYAYIDDYTEAEKFLGKEFAGSMYTIAKDVKIQVEFNPAHVKSYRLIGYENRVLAAEDFNNDKKDAGEIGSGHTVTALYEIRADEFTAAGVDSLKYQQTVSLSNGAYSQELATVKFRYKKPDGDQSILLSRTISGETHRLAEAEESTRFAITVATFGQLLRKSPYVKSLSPAQVIDMATAAQGADKEGLRQEFIDLVKEYKKLEGLAKN